MSEFDYGAVGGIPLVQGDSTAWNFGVVGQIDDPTDTFSVVAPQVMGRWDGQSTVNLHHAAIRVTGKALPARRQNIGACGGYAGARGIEHLQCVQIASGKREKYIPVSHAFIYAMARQKHGMLGGGDGVPGGSVPPLLAQHGVANAEETNDRDFNSNNSDVLARRWGREGVPANIYQLAKDNLVKGVAKVTTAEELADGLAAGAVAIISNAQGFTMTRDNEGFCSPRGTWYHYHVFSGVLKTASGRKGFAYEQSWGENTPSGPLLPSFPSHCFGVDWDVAERMIRTGACHLVTGFEGWIDESAPKKSAWIF